MTRLRVERSPRSGQDIIDIAVALGEHDSRLIDRFFEAIERALDLLAEHPRGGSPYHSTDPRLAGLRKWPVPGFPNHWLFYRPSLEAILIVPVLYAGFFGRCWGRSDLGRLGPTPATRRPTSPPPPPLPAGDRRT